LYVVGQAFQRGTIGSLPDNVLLDIFDFYQVSISKNEKDEPAWSWEKLVHVCQRWRYIIFESPIRLNLQLFCTETSPVGELLDVWPELPLVIEVNYDYSPAEWDELSDNIVAALERCDRVRQIDIVNSPPEFGWEELVRPLEEPFPALRSFTLESRNGWTEPLQIPDTFLNGSAPSLQYLALRDISFPSLPRFLSSTNNLTSLHLYDIPDSGYIPPKKMATSLSALPKLKSLIIDLDFSTPRRIRMSGPPNRFILPALTRLEFTGISEYFEVLTARMDVPLLNDFRITLFHRLVFDMPETVRFFGHLDTFRSSSLTLNFDPSYGASISLTSNTLCHSANSLTWCIERDIFNWQVISVAQIRNTMRAILPFLSSVESLNIKYDDRSDSQWIQQVEMDPTLWSQLFHSLTSVQSLHIPAILVSSISAVLHGLTGESAAEILPSLHSLFIIGDISDEAAQQRIQSFITARQQGGRPIVFSHHKSE
jgi:hypothetical protein